MDCTAHRLIADVAVIAGAHVLLVRYHDTTTYDGQEGWFLPDDQLRHGEDPHDGARRILAEQVGLEAESVQLGHVESFIGPDRAWHIVFHLVAQVPSSDHIEMGVNVRDAQWFASYALPDARDVAHDGRALEVIEGLQSAGAF